MKPMRKQSPLAQHPLISGTKFDLGDGESMTEMQKTIHVGIWICTEPFRMLFLDFHERKPCHIGFDGGINLEETFRCPTFLIFSFQRDQVVTFRSLDSRRRYPISENPEKQDVKAPGQVLWYWPYWTSGGREILCGRSWNDQDSVCRGWIS
jgi:hypothetical protein